MQRLICFSLAMALSTSAFALIGGSKAKDSEGKGVIQILVQDKNNPEVSNQCTASKIGRNVLLTAAHCFENIKEHSGILGFTEKTDNSKFDYEGAYISNVVIHPTYVFTSDENEESGTSDEIDDSQMSDLIDMESGNIDMALIFLNPGPKFEEIAILLMDFEFVSPLSTVEMWGYGCQKTTNNIDNYRPLKKHGVSYVLDKSVLSRSFGVFTKAVHKEAETIFQNNILTAGLNIDPKVASACFGDSGGPLLRNGKIVGVNASYLAKDMDIEGKSPSGKTDVNFHQRLSVVKDWIEQELRKNK